MVKKKVIMLTDFLLLLQKMSLVLDGFNQVKNINTGNVYSGL